MSSISVANSESPGFFQVKHTPTSARNKSRWQCFYTYGTSWLPFKIKAPPCPLNEAWIFTCLIHTSAGVNSEIWHKADWRWSFNSLCYYKWGTWLLCLSTQVSRICPAPQQTNPHSSEVDFKCCEWYRAGAQLLPASFTLPDDELTCHSPSAVKDFVMVIARFLFLLISLSREWSSRIGTAMVCDSTALLRFRWQPAVFWLTGCSSKICMKLFFHGSAGWWTGRTRWGRAGVGCLVTWAAATYLSSCERRNCSRPCRSVLVSTHISEEKPVNKCKLCSQICERQFGMNPRSLEVLQNL